MALRDNKPVVKPKPKPLPIEAETQKVRQSEGRSDELATAYLVSKTTRARTSVQDAPPP